MSLIRLYPRLRIQAALGGPRGIAVEEAIGRATAEINVWSDSAFEAIDAAISDIRQLCADKEAPLVSEDVFRLAELVANLAGLYSPPLCRAAQSLCVLARKPRKGAELERSAVSVHIESMVLLRALGPEENPATSKILNGLHAVVAKAR
jgi:hypothetical protein